MLTCRKDSAVKGIKFYWCNREVSNEKVKVYFDKFENSHKLEIAKLEERIADLEMDNKTLKAMNIYLRTA